jgi:2,3-bisphosphoglycerate-dependent phosphoglycerate mutase
MRQVYIVTHAQATHHVDEVVGGWYDSQLTPAGERAAAAIGTRLRSLIPVGADVEVYSSDLKRAQQTAAPVCKMLGVRPVLDDRLREKSYGEGEGRPQVWFRARFVPPPATGDRMNHDEGIAGAETRAVFARRLYAAMDDILQSQCEHQVIVTHGGVVTFLLAAWIKVPISALDYANFDVASGSITKLQQDDYFHSRRVLALGETSHLDSAGATPVEPP